MLPEEPTFSGVMTATPLVLDGRVYLQSLRSNVYALDARTGTLRWTRHFSRGSGGPNGLAAGYGRLYGATDTSIFALDRRTGRVLWTRRVARSGELVDIAPAVARGLVFAGTTAQRAGSTGSLLALDAGTGRPRWRFGTVPGGFAHPRLASGGGVWWTPTIDRGGGLWAGTANPLPWGGSRALPNGGAYRGAARYTDSLLALGAADGKLRWFDQVTPHDVRDYDFALPPMLARAGGRDLAIGSGKGGRVIAWNRRTRARVWSTAVGTHRNDTGPLPRAPVSVCPGLLGGVLTPMALARGRVFVPVVDLCMQGSSIGYESFSSVDYARRGRGELVALAAATGARRLDEALPLARLRLRDGRGGGGLHDDLRRPRVRALAADGPHALERARARRRERVPRGGGEPARRPRRRGALDHRDADAGRGRICLVTGHASACALLDCVQSLTFVTVSSYP